MKITLTCLMRHCQSSLMNTWWHFPMKSLATNQPHETLCGHHGEAQKVLPTRRWHQRSEWQLWDKVMLQDSAHHTGTSAVDVVGWEASGKYSRDMNLAEGSSTGKPNSHPTGQAPSVAGLRKLWLNNRWGEGEREREAWSSQGWIRPRSQSWI